MKHKFATVAVSILASTAALAPLASAQAGKSASGRTTMPESLKRIGAGPANLSEINGVPVKVGDHNQYYYVFRRWNISTNPLGWAFGLLGASVSYGFSNHAAIRFDANYYSLGGSHGTEFGVGMPLYLRRTYSGPFLEPGLIVRHSVDPDPDWGSETTTIGPQVLAGWHWQWDSGFNVAMAAGGGRDIGGSTTYTGSGYSSAGYDSYDSYSGSSGSSDSSGQLFINGYLRFGYMF